MCAFEKHYTSASQSPDSGPDPDPEGIQSGPASISYLKSTNYISYFDKRMLNFQIICLVFLNAFLEAVRNQSECEIFKLFLRDISCHDIQT